MKREPVAGVQPEILRWARLTIGLSIAEVAKTLKRSEEEIDAWENGQATPTYAQLEKLAYQIYKRPLAVFFLPVPPEETLPQREFRTLPEADLALLSRDTHLHIRRAHAYQLALTELFDGRNPVVDHRIWRSITLSHTASITEQAEHIREFLGITLDEQTQWRSDERALKVWRKSIEDSGVFVFKAPFKQKDISGFCLKDDDLPIIYLNNSTTKTRQTFSLLHELAHLLFHVNGISKFDTAYVDRLPHYEAKVEQFCNAIAAEVLIPSADFLRQATFFPADVEKSSEELFSNLASRYGVSREAVLRRFRNHGRVSAVFYERKATEWAAQRTDSGGGGSWQLNQKAYLSEKFTKEVIGRHYRHQLTLEQAADFLGIKPRNFAGFEERILQVGGA